MFPAPAMLPGKTGWFAAVYTCSVGLIPSLCLGGRKRRQHPGQSREGFEYRPNRLPTGGPNRLDFFAAGPGGEQPKDRWTPEGSPVLDSAKFSARRRQRRAIQTA